MARPHPLVTKSMRIYYPMNISVFNLVWGYSDDQIPTDILKPNIVERTDPPTKGTELENLIIDHGAFPPIRPYFATQQKDTSTTEEAAKTTQIKGDDIVPSENSLSQVKSTTLDTTAEVVAEEWEFFAEFTNKNKIPPFRRDRVPSLGEQASSNDDLKVSHYESSPYTYMGQQRRGDFEPIKDADNHLDRIYKAIELEFFLARQIPLPEEMHEANKFITSAPPESIIAFRNKQLARLDTMITQAATTQKEWQQQTPDSIKCVTGELKTVTIAQLLDYYNMGGQQWIQQFIYGFPLIGTLSQKGAFPEGKESGTEPMQQQHIWARSQARFLERSKLSGYKNSQRLWDEALVQVAAGWLGEPIPIPCSGILPDIRPEGINIAFRFGVEQGNKLRACDDLKHNWANLACSVWTPITLPTWDHVAQTALNLRSHNLDWEFFKADHASAYKNPPAPTRTRPPRLCGTALT